MKKCPKCNRTYADDGFTFCLEDGALLSAPFDPKQDEPISTIQSGGPPPTAVLPADSGRRETEMTPAPLPPTIASSASDARGSKPLFPPHLEPMVSAAKRSKLPFIAISALVLIILLGSVSLFAFKRAQCSKVKIYCSQYLNFATCFLDNEEPDLRIRSNANPKEDIGPATSSLHPIMALQAAVMPKGVSNIKWTISPGKLEDETSGFSPNRTIDTTGFSGQTITVKATFTAEGWFCSNTASTSFVAK